jgi:hypothetical protein
MNPVTCRSQDLTPQPSSAAPQSPALPPRPPAKSPAALDLCCDTLERPGGALTRTLSQVFSAPDLTARFERLRGEPLAPATLAQLRRKKIVFVRGYLAQVYRAVGGGYLDKHADFCRRLGMQVLIGDVSCCSTARRNSQSLYEQLKLHTSPDDSVIIVAHSAGSLAVLDLLRDPRFADIHERIDAFIPINGVFRGTPLVDLMERLPLVGELVSRFWGRVLAVAGGEADTLRELATARRQAYLQTYFQEIRAMLERVTVVPLVSSFNIPHRVTDSMGLLLLLAQVYMRLLGEANDGCVPERSQMLPGAGYVTLHGVHHAATIDDLGRLDLDAMMRGLLAVTLDAMPPERRARGVTPAPADRGTATHMEISAA